MMSLNDVIINHVSSNIPPANEAFDWLQTIGVAAACVAAVTACVATIVACYTVRKAHQTAQAQLITALLGEYGSAKIGNAMTELVGFKEGCEKNDLCFADEYKKLRNTGQKRGEELNAFRRPISHYFNKVYRLRKLELLDDTYVEVVADKGQAEFLLYVLEPIEAQQIKDKQCAPDVYEFFSERYDLPRFEEKRENDEAKNSAALKKILDKKREALKDGNQGPGGD